MHLVASEGHRLLPDYTFDAHTGQWRHEDGGPRATMSLSDLSYRSGKLEFRARMLTEPEWALAGYLDAARRIFAAAGDRHRAAPRRSTPPAPSDDFEALRWFPLPGEAAAEVLRAEDGRAAAERSAAL